MRLSEIWNKKGTKKLSLLKVLAPVALLTFTIVFLTFYGVNTGNFSIGVSSNAYDRNISISITPDSNENKKTIYVNSRNLLPINLLTVESQLDEITTTDGEYKGKYSRNIVAYSFYIKNESSSLSFDLAYSILLRDIKKYQDEIRYIKIMVISDDEKTIYQSSLSEKKYQDDYSYYDFDENAKEIVVGKPKIISARSERKYTILFWYDGDEMVNANINKNDILESLKFQINFEIVD
ncbi:hypothetical protein [Haploplasma axanthum]|uniref:Uncharacterized protein n=1 Tax=Haploplasma axanthum TaxID=29552 RepID=A0A449BDU0_HAPAX|nr:hypothetical protein [Haploplasma axanthum]VEU80623.1 Uncharacterised protein [Haploplasma axanthum]